MSSKKSKAPAKKGLAAWIFDFAGEKKGPYLWSVFFALLSVACCIAPYFIIVQIAHRLKTVRNANQIVVINKGRIVEQGDVAIHNSF